MLFFKVFVVVFQSFRCCFSKFSLLFFKVFLVVFQSFPCFKQVELCLK